MKFFRRGDAADAYGAIVDIGSGSVLVSVVHSQLGQESPHIVWSHRERAPLQNIDSLEQSAKAVLTALVNASMMLDAHGREALRLYQPAAKLTHLQCSISAPWAYTVTKTINYTQEQAFTVTEELITELTQSVQNKITEELETNDVLQELNLKIVNRQPMDLLTNGYRVANPIGRSAKTIMLAQANAVTQQTLIDAVAEMHSKLLPETTLEISSFAIMLHTTALALMKTFYDVCLVDITYEATEIGIIRDGVLKYCTHTPFGFYSLLREISKITNLPLAEISGHAMDGGINDFIATLPKSQRDETETVFENYTEKVAALLHETGDDLSIPKQIAIHCEKELESFFSELITKAVKRTIKSEPVLYPITKEIVTLLEKNLKTDKKGKRAINKSDTALLLSAQFFHMRHQG